MRPNVIIINPDEMRADTMHHLGNAAAFTPNLDRLAKEGVSFSNAYCQNAVCVPSRCSFLTGLYPHVFGHRTMSHLLHSHEQNLFSDMKANGYYTVSSTRGDFMAGKLASYHRKLIDEYIMVPKPSKKLSRFVGERGSPESDTFYSFLAGIIPSTKNNCTVTNIDDLTVEGAIRSIKRRPRNKPFFMFLGLMYPHPPYRIEKKYYDLIDKSKLPPRIPTIRDEDGKPSMEIGLRNSLRIASWDENRLNEIRTVYLAMCAKVDDQVGRIVSTLKNESIYDNTVILFLSDHGDYTTDFGIVEKAQNCFPDCLTNVPFLIKPQKGVPIDHGINDNLVELVDVSSTVADLAGIKINRETFSKSLLPMIGDKHKTVRQFVSCEGGRLKGERQCDEYHNGDFVPLGRYAPRQLLQADEDGKHTKAVMLRTKRYKYIRRFYETDEFYDLKYGEQVNQINNSDYKEIIADLRTKMLDWYMETCDVVPMEYDDRFTPEFLVNNMTAYGVPRMISHTLALYLKITGKPASPYFHRLLKRQSK